MTKELPASQLDWNNLGFTYRDLPYRFIAHFKNGAWDHGHLTADSTLQMNEAAAVFHYGQANFEGLKAYRTQDNHIQLFRPDRNAMRMHDSCERLLMPPFPQDAFVEACKEVVLANEDYVPPYGTGATLYLRPFMIGTGSVIGVKPADEYLFVIFATPVGSYYKGGLKPTNFTTSYYDRAAPHGTGKNKVAGNYASSLLPGDQAHQAGYSDVIYLDPATHSKIEEAGSANFFGITNDNRFITPKSDSILPSITKYSLLTLAQERLGLDVEEGDIYIDHLDQFKEAGAMGTAAVISPIGGIEYQDHLHIFYSETEVGPITQQLYDELTGIQFGDIKAPAGWIQRVK